MNPRKFILALSFFIATAHFSAFSQQDTVGLRTIIAKTMKLADEHPIEKVHLHFDKPYYAVGDTMWFKAYLTIGQHQPSPLSKVIYVDVISAGDSLVQTLMLPIINGTTSGHVPLDALSYKQGNYYVRAYTNWMRNSDPTYFFNKTISIGNAIDNEIITHITFATTTTDKSSKINANVRYNDADDKPYADKRVSWRVESGGDVISKGKASTDKNGVANIIISSNQLSTLKSAQLITTMDMGNRKTLNRTFPLRAAANAIDVQFFPEGGTFVNGIRTRVAFKVLKPNGSGMDIKGNVTDNDGKVVAELSSQHLGMGLFILQPENGKTYKANVNFPDGTKGTYDLPKAQLAGMSLAVNNSEPDNVNLKILTNNEFFQSNQNKRFYIIAQSSGVVCYAAQTVLQNQVYSAAIAKSKFPTGIVQITLFAENGAPLAERIAFIDHNDQLTVSLNDIKSKYTARQKVKINLSAKSQTQPVEANLSVAVLDETKVPFNENAETTILSNLLLTSDLKGYIEKPNYYFNNKNAKTAEDLDLLMLTQGYRRFSYQDIIANKFPPVAFLPEDGIQISGTLRTLNGMPVKNGNVRLLIPEKYYSTHTVTNAEGMFKFSKMVIPDSSKVTINAKDNVNNKNLMIMLDVARGQPITENYNAADEDLNIDSTLTSYLQNSKKQFSRTRMLKEVVIKGNVNEVKPSHADYPSLTGLSSIPDHLINGDRFKDCPNFLSCLQSQAMGLTYIDNNLYITRDYNAGKKTPVQIFLSGMPVDMFALNNINSAEVESVEIFLKDDLSGINRMYNTNGVVVINTKKVPKGTKISIAELQELFPPKYLVNLMPRGYAMAREFYSPKYDGPKMSQPVIDLRSTIYWNPKVMTDKTGNTSFEYYNSDGKGSYRVIVEGIDSDGHIGRYVYRYKVE